MLRNLVLVSALVCLPLGAFASDLPSKKAPQAPMLKQSIDWTGAYAGVSGGYGSSSVDGQYDMEDFDTGDIFVVNGEGAFDFSPQNFLGSAHLGYNYQVGNYVLGIEGDINGMKMTDTLVYRNDSDQLDIELNWVATVRGRAGILASENLLVYATAGVAFADYVFKADDNIDDNDPADRGSRNLNAVGLALGGGLEYAINQSWSVRADALYVTFDQNENIDGVVPSDSGDFGDNITINDYVAGRVGVSYKF